MKRVRIVNETKLTTRQLAFVMLAQIVVGIALGFVLAIFFP